MNFLLLLKKNQICIIVKLSSDLIIIFSTDIIDCSLNQIKVPAELIKRVGTSCFALESIPFSIAIFLRNLTDFRAGILEAVNCGGDTDSNASMVGAMIGANVGLKGIPKEWLEAVPDCQEALQLADGMYQVLEARKK
jgi:ADP-ribosylglycohydrolase